MSRLVASETRTVRGDNRGRNAGNPIHAKILTPESSGEKSICLDRIVRAAALHRSRRAETD